MKPAAWAGGSWGPALRGCLPLPTPAPAAHLCLDFPLPSGSCVWGSTHRDSPALTTNIKILSGLCTAGPLGAPRPGGLCFTDRQSRGIRLTSPAPQLTLRHP